MIMQKNNKGITLISLIITIIILIILTGIVINLSIGNEGLFKKASLSKEQYTIESIREKLEIKKVIPYIEKEGNITVDEYLQYLETEK